MGEKPLGKIWRRGNPAHEREEWGTGASGLLQAIGYCRAQGLSIYPCEVPYTRSG